MLTIYRYFLKILKDASRKTNIQKNIIQFYAYIYIFFNAQKTLFYI